MKPLLPCVLLGVVSSMALADDSDETLRFYLSKSQLVIVGTVTKEPQGGVVDELGVVNYYCRFRVTDVIKGTVDQTQELRVNVKRFIDTGGIPKDGERNILFLSNAAHNVPHWETADFWFGVWPHNRWMERSLKRIVAEMVEEARWAALRRLDPEWQWPANPEHLPELFRIADGDDREVALESLLRLGGFRGNSDVSAFLTRKMNDANPHLALQAAIMTCRFRDSSGFEMLFSHVAHDNPELRHRAITELKNVHYRRHRKRIVALLLDRLEQETDPALIERTLQSLASWRSAEIVEAVTPFVEHESEQVSARAQWVIDLTTEDLGAEP